LLDNIGDLSKPVTILIEKVSNAVGVLYQPTHIKRIARAELEAEKIRAIGGREITEIQHRVLDRLIHQEGRKQDNIEEITAQALTMLPDNAEVEGLDEDWIAHFFKQCETVSDKEMQSFWARLLAGEATKPGQFSKRTIVSAASLDKRDAELFSSLCQFNWWFWDGFQPLIYHPDNELFRTRGLTFPAFKHLESIGLISLGDHQAGYSFNVKEKFVKCRYYDVETLVELPNEQNNRLAVGRLMLTVVGLELARICEVPKNDEFYDYVIRLWHNFGYVTSTAVPSEV
jgi:hypothetical protein